MKAHANAQTKTGYEERSCRPKQLAEETDVVNLAFSR